jgi:hypothetical protein
MCVNDALQLAEDKARVYGEELEYWKKDHLLAMLYYDFQDLIDEGVGLFDSVTRIDEDWRGRVLKHEFGYDPIVAEKIRDVYKILGDRFHRTGELLTFFESRFSVANATEFRSRWSELRGILTSDAEFFVGDALVALCDTAIDENRKGETYDVSGAR